MRKAYYLFITLMLFASEFINSQEITNKNAKADPAPDEENLNVFQQWIKWNNGGNLLINHLNKQAARFFEARDTEISKLKTKDDWLKRQAFVKAKINELAGPFPEKTPLNPKITGTIKKDGYHIDKIVFEAMPGYYVTGCIYVPDGIKGKAPAILNVCGHNPDAFRMPLYQVVNYNLVKKGMIVFAIDPPGQAEHVQYFDKEINTSSIGYSVIEHMYFGNQCFLTGSCGARYFIWEGIRGIDYLVSRKDVDPERIGVTGWSGGAQVTTYISAFDDRVKVSIPCAGSIINRRLLETKGIQDAESFFIGGVASGITFNDFIEVRAPKPTLMAFTSRDEYLTMQSQREAYAEAIGAFKALGNEENLKVSEDDSRHWQTSAFRNDMYAFFMKHFNLPGDPSEIEAEIIPAEELKVTSTGQILTSYGGNMIFDENKKDAVKLVENLERSREDIDTHISQVKINARRISGFIDPSGEDIHPLMNGRYRRDGYTVAKYAIMGEGDYAIPILLFVPDDKNRHPAIAYIHSKGKVTEAKPGGEIEKLVRKGYVVAAADVIGTGETKNTVTNRQGTADAGSTSVILGRSVVGLQAADIIRVVNYLKTLTEVDTTKMGAIGIDEMCMPLIHAAAFESSINSVALMGSLISYRTVAMNRIYKIGLIPVNKKSLNMPYEIDYNWIIAGVLKGYDLPDLIGCIAPRKVVMTGLKDHALEPASDDLIDLEMTFPRAVYKLKGVPDNLKIISKAENQSDLAELAFR